VSKKQDRFSEREASVFNRINNFRENTIRLQGTYVLTLIFLLIEFFDELHYGVEGSELPAIRMDFGLTYGQIGLLLGLPHFVGSLIEPLIMLLGDTRLRKGLMIGGGLALFLLLGSIARATTFPVLLAAMFINYPASGAFVSLAQASLIDMNPGRQSRAMARWTVAGSLGNLLGPLIIAAGFSLEWGWRWAFMALSLLALVLVVFITIFKMNNVNRSARITQTPPTPATGLKLTPHHLRGAVSNRLLLRWVGLLQISDLLLDVFTGYAVLYFSDVA
jgi:FSR family fosmidomycin resistance protein-like MFS transporter